jgi:hypothetical protein
VFLNPFSLWFELPDFALEIIDTGVRIRLLTLKIFDFLAELLMPRIQIFVVGLKVTQAFLEVLTIGLMHLVLQHLLDAFHPLCEVIRYVLLGHTVTSLSLAPTVGVQVLVDLPGEYITYKLLSQ